MAQRRRSPSWIDRRGCSGDRIPREFAGYDTPRAAPAHSGAGFQGRNEAASGVAFLDRLRRFRALDSGSGLRGQHLACSAGNANHSDSMSMPDVRSVSEVALFERAGPDAAAADHSGELARDAADPNNDLRTAHCPRTVRRSLVRRRGQRWATPDAASARAKAAATYGARSMTVRSRLGASVLRKSEAS